MVELPAQLISLQELISEDPDAWLGNYLRGNKLIDMRRTSEKKPGVFPYASVKVPIILIAERTILIANGIIDKIRLLELAEDNRCILLAAWPGRMSQDIFLVDNQQYALGVLKSHPLAKQRK